MQLNPNDSHIIANASKYYLFFGDLDRARELIDRAMQLNPLHPGWYWTCLGTNYYLSGDFETAAECMRKNTQQGGHDHVWLAMCYHALGETEHAAKSVADALAVDDTASVAKYTQWDTYRDPATLEGIRERMAAIGLPA